MATSTAQAVLNMPAQISTPSTMADTLSLDKLTLMETSMAKQHINMGIDDLMYQLSKLLADVTKPKLRSEFRSIGRRI